MVLGILQNNFQGKHGWVVSNDFYLDSTESNTIFIRAKGDQGLNEKCPSDIAEWISEGGGSITFSIACEAQGDRQRCPSQFPFAFNEGLIVKNKWKQFQPLIKNTNYIWKGLSMMTYHNRKKVSAFFISVYFFANFFQIL